MLLALLQNVNLPGTYSTGARAPFYAPRGTDEIGWNGSSIAMSVALGATLTPANQLTSNFYAPRGVEEIAWSNTVAGARTLALLSASPFVPKFWRNNYAPDPDWQGAPVNAGTLRQLVVGGNPFTPRKWSIDAQVDATWSGVASRNSALLAPGTQAPFKPAFAFVRAADDSVWTGAPSAAIMSAPAQSTPRAPFYTPRGFDVDPWYAAPTSSFNALQYVSALYAYQAPNWNALAAFNDDPYWRGQSSASLAILNSSQTAQTIPGATFYAPRGVEADFWSGASFASPAMLHAAASVNPFFAPMRRVDFSPEPDWHSGPSAARSLAMLSFSPTSRMPTWKLDHTPDPNWSGSPLSANLILKLATGGQPNPRFWRGDVVPDPAWFTASPVVNRALLATLGVPTPFQQNWMRADHTPDPVWLGTPSGSLVIPILTGGGKPLATPTSRFIVTPDDAAFWRPTIGANALLAAISPVPGRLWRQDVAADPTWSPAFGDARIIRERHRERQEIARCVGVHCALLTLAVQVKTLLAMAMKFAEFPARAKPGVGVESGNSSNPLCVARVQICTL